MGLGKRVGVVCLLAFCAAACSGESSVDTGDDDSNGDDSSETGGSSSGGTGAGGTASGGQSNTGGGSGARAKISLTLKKVTP